MPDAFDVESTNAVKEDKLRDFLNSTLEPELGSIPMVGPATVKALDEAGIKNSVSVPCGREPTLFDLPCTFSGVRAYGASLNPLPLAFPAVQPFRNVFNAEGHGRDDAAALRCVRPMVGARRQGSQIICICRNYLHRAKMQYDDTRDIQ